MPVLPLYDPTPGVMWKNVRAPGGYEMWECILEDKVIPMTIVISFYDGRTLDTDYRRAFSRYLRRPTTTTPPLPEQYRGVGVCIKASPSGQHASNIKTTADEFEAKMQQLCWHIGPDSIVGDAESVRIHIDHQDLQLSLTLALPGVMTMNDPEAGLPPQVDNATLKDLPASGEMRLKSTTHQLSGRATLSHAYGLQPMQEPMQK